ncbi:MAG: hypothetical protein ACXW30_02865 [Micavibrio sp.]
MNTAPDQPDDVDLLVIDTQDNQNDDLYRALSESSGELQEIKEKRLQERFYYVCAIVIICNILFAQTTPKTVIVITALMEIPILLSLAERWGVRAVCEWTDKGFDVFKKYCETKIPKRPQ